MQIRGRTPLERIRIAFIVFVLLRNGEMHVFSGFKDVTEEYADYRDQLQRWSHYETEDPYPEETPEAIEPGPSDTGVLPKAETLLGPVHLTYPEGPANPSPGPEGRSR